MCVYVCVCVCVWPSFSGPSDDHSEYTNIYVCVYMYRRKW